jgi:hypothetical protein
VPILNISIFKIPIFSGLMSLMPGVTPPTRYNNMKQKDSETRSRLSLSRRSSSEERENIQHHHSSGQQIHNQIADESFLSDNMSMLSMSTSNIGPGQHQYSSNTRMSQYSPRTWTMMSNSSRSNSLLTNMSEDQTISMMPCNHEETMLQEVQGKQSHFFNSLFPSRANRFGFPVYPERSFGIPSQMNVPVSFAGFSPGTRYLIDYGKST